MAKKTPESKRISVSVRLTETTATRLREFIRYHAGHPLFLELGPFVENAVLAEIRRTENQKKAPASD